MNTGSVCYGDMVPAHISLWLVCLSGLIVVFFHFCLSQASVPALLKRAVVNTLFY